MKISFRSISFLLLLFISISPLVIISAVVINGVLNQLRGLEEEYEKLLLEQNIAPVESQITVYKELIRFVSQLPAVIEILDKGDVWEGSIEKERAAARYTGVINRSFSNYPEIISVHIYNMDDKELLHIEKDTNQKFQYESKIKNRIYSDHENFRKIPALNRLETIAVPKVVNALSGENSKARHLILQMFAPVRFQEKNIGIFVSDIDLGILSKAYPNIHWIFSDGSYLSKQTTDVPAFERFPGLAEIISSEKSGITGESPELSWVRVFIAQDKNISLWAGREVQLKSTKDTKEKFNNNIIIGIFAAGFLILSISFYISGQVHHFLVSLVSWMKSSIKNGDARSRRTLTRIRELDEFIRQLERLITDQKKHEKILSDAALEWQTTFDATKRVVWLLDNENRIIRANKATETIFKCPVESVIEKYCWEIVYKTDKPPQNCPFEQNKNNLVKTEAEIQVDDYWFEVTSDPILNEKGELVKTVHIMNDITERKNLEIEKEKLIERLQTAFDEINVLSGLLPICSSCKKIRDDKGYWNNLEAYIEKYSNASFSHGMCPECMDKFYGNEDWYLELKKNEKKD